MASNRRSALAALAAAALALALAALPWAASDPDDAAIRPPAGPRDGASTATATAVAVVGGPDARVADTAEPPRVPAARQPAVVRLRCVAWDGGAPLAGSVLLADGVACAVGGADGVVAFERDDADAVTLELRVPGHVAVVRTLPAGGGGGSDVGDVAMRAGATVCGVLADERQQPCAGVRVRVLAPEPLTRSDGWSERWPQQATTAADGTFALGAPVPPGLAPIATDGGTPLIGPTQVELRAGADHELLLVCRASGAADWIHGMVRDANGAPVANAIVQASAAGVGVGVGGGGGGGGTAGSAGAAAGGGSGAGIVSAGSARSGDDGAFRLFRGDCAAGEVQLVATAVALDRCSAPIGPVAWGARGVEVALPAAPALALRVRCAATGEPVEAFAVQCVRTTGVRAVDVPRRRARTAGGVSWIDGVAPGPGMLVVWPDDPRWLPAGPIAFEHDGGGGALDVVLPRASRCPVLVHTAAGKVVAGAVVELLVPAGGDVVRDLERLFDGGGSRGPVTLCVARATTGADGVAWLRWHADPRALALRVHGPGVAPRAFGEVHVGEHAVEVVVDDAARLELALRGGAGARVALRRDGERLPPSWAPPWQLDGNGAGAFDVPAGRWEWELQRPLAVDGRAAAVWFAVPLGDALELRAGSTLRIERDVAGALAAGEVAGAAFVDGEPAERVVLACGEADGGEVRVRHVVEQAPDARGAFRFTAVPPGVHSLQLRLRCGATQVVVPLAPRLELGAGERRELAAFAVATAPVTVRVRGGAPRTLVELFAPPVTAVLGPLDADGEVRFARLPAGSYRVRLRGDAEPRELGAIEVRGGAAAAFELDAR